MIVGVPKEIKVAERRVGLTPVSVRELVERGHSVIVERGAGDGIAAGDSDYEAVGATIAATAEAVWSAAELVVKVKEPQAVERQMLRSSQILFTYLHLAPDLDQTQDLVASGAACIAYETVTARTGGLPLLMPMSQVAGRLSVQAAARTLEAPMGGRGVLMGGVPGVPAASVVIVGGGVVGENAAAMAVGLGADVTVIDRDLTVLDRLDRRFGPLLRTQYSTATHIESAVEQADAVIGAVLVSGAAAPKLVTEAMVADMRDGSVIVDVAIDQGGCVATSHPTTHTDPTYVVDGVVHYCVANMPGAVPATSTFALNNATLPFVTALADRGLDALRADPMFLNGLNVYRGKVTEPHVAAAHGLEYIPAAEALG